VSDPQSAWALAYLISGALENISRVIAMSPDGLKQVNRKILAAAFVRFIERLRIDKSDSRMLGTRACLRT
jgi:AraC-like DNA-binding protein